MKLSINGIKNTTDWEKAGIKLLHMMLKSA